MIQKDKFKRKLPEPHPKEWVPGIDLPFKCTFYPLDLFIYYTFIRHLKYDIVVIYRL